MAIGSEGSSLCSILSIHWSPGNVIAYPDSIYNFIINDTGTYQASVYVDTYGQTGIMTCNVSVHYRSATPVLEVINPNAFQIYPSVSTGIFHIKAEGELKKISIYDAMGRVVYAGVQNPEHLPDINLTDFSNGIYLYAIEDNKEQVFRGKIVKE